MKVELPKDECSESVDGRGSMGENAGLEERMLRSELRLAESERETRALRETLSAALSDIETWLRPLEHGSGQPAQDLETVAKAHVPASMGNPAVEVADCSEQPELSAYRELNGLMAWLEQRLDVLAVDVSTLSTNRIALSEEQASLDFDLGMILYPCKALVVSAPREWHSR